jgi:hypothetical protein
MSNIIIIESAIIVFILLLYAFMKIKKYASAERKFLVLFISILLFEFMSAPMWQFTSFQSWTYIWQSISWIIILGWSSIFMFSFLLVDSLFRYLPDKRRFWLYLVFVQIIVVPIESYLITSGIKSYSPILANTFTGLKIPLTTVPLEIMAAVPLFATLIICFYKYINYISKK